MSETNLQAWSVFHVELTWVEFEQWYQSKSIGRCVYFFKMEI